MVNQIQLAKKIATEAHEDQTRWGGEPYITHPEAVVAILQEDPMFNFSEEVYAVAWLHDVVEDTNVTLDDLRKEGFNTDVVSAVDAITKREDEDYSDYILRLSLNPTASIVKRADITHNLKDLKPGHRQDKYKIAYVYLDLHEDTWL